MDEKKTGFFSSMLSFSKPGLASDLIAKGLGKAIGYFVVLCLLLTAVRCVGLYISMYPMGGVDAFINAISDYAPDFELKDGKLSVAQSPYIKQADHILVVFENSEDKANFESYRTQAAEQEKELIYANNNSIIFAYDDSVQEHAVKDYPLNITKSEALSFIKNWAWVVILLLAIMMMIVFLMSGAVYALIIGLLCVILKSIMAIDNELKDLITLSFYAVTLVLIVEAILGFAAFFTPISMTTLPFFLSFPASLGVMYLYMSTLKKEPNGGQDVYYHDAVDAEYTEADDKQPDETSNEQENDELE